MSRNKIRIDGDFTGFLRGMGKVSKEFQKLSKVSIKLDNKDMKNFREFNVKVFKDLNKEVEKFQGKLEKIHKARVAGTINNSQIAQEKLINRLIEKRTSELEDKKDYTKVAIGFKRRGARMSAGSASGSMGEMAGDAMSGIGAVLGGLGTLGMAAGAIGGAALGIRALTAPRRALADQNLRFRGLSRGNVSDSQLTDLRNAGQGLGYGARESMSAANMLQKNIGNVTARKELQELFMQTRMTGMSTEEIGGIAASFRGAAVDSKGANLQQNLHKTRELFKTAMISALDTSGAIKFMQTTSEMVDQIANEGSADATTITENLRALAANSNFFKANASRGAAAIGAVENFFKSNQGTGIAMRSLQASAFQGGPMASLLQQSLGFGETIPGLGAAAFNKSKLLGNTVKQLAGASTGLPFSDKDMTPDDFRKMNSEQKAGAMLALKQQTGMTGSNASELLEAIFTGNEKRSEELLGGIKTEKDILNNVDMGIKNNEAVLEKIFLDIASRLTPSVVNIEGMMTRLVDKITGTKTQRSVRVLEGEAQAAEETATRNKGSAWNAIKGAFGGSDKDVAKQAFSDLGMGKILEGGDLASKEAAALSATLGLGPNGSISQMKDSNMFNRSQYDQLSTLSTGLEKNIKERQEAAAYSSMDSKSKEEFDKQFTEERALRVATLKALHRLVALIGQRPVLKTE